MATTLEYILGTDGKEPNPTEKPAASPQPAQTITASEKPAQDPRAERPAETITASGKPAQDPKAEAGTGTGQTAYAQSHVSSLAARTAAELANRAASAQQPQQLSMAQIYEMINGAPPQLGVSKEEREKQEKRHRRNQMFAAIGDGLAALSNLYFTTQYAPSMYTPTNTLSQKEQERYDRVQAANAAVGDRYRQWWEGYMKARQADIDSGRADRKEAYQREQDERQADQWRQQFNFNVEQAKRKGELDKAKLEEDKRQFGERQKLERQKHADSMRQQQSAVAAAAASGSKRKRIGFSDGTDKNQVSIHEDVWSGSMQAVFDTLVEELKPADKKEQQIYRLKIRGLDTAQKKDDFVKQNWWKSGRARQAMVALSRLDPATMRSGTQDPQYGGNAPLWGLKPPGAELPATRKVRELLREANGTDDKKDKTEW